MKPQGYNLNAIRRENLRLLKTRFGSIAHINELMGVKKNAPYLYNVLCKDASNLGTKKARQIEKALDLAPGWMDVNHEGGADYFEAMPQVMPDTVSVAIMPLYGSHNISKTHVFLDSYDFTKNFPGSKPENFRGVVVIDDSIERTAAPGDRLLIDITMTEPAVGIFVIKTSGRLLLRRIRADITGELVVMVDDTGAQAPFNPAQHAILGRAVYHWRGSKLI